ncbi:MAG: pterin-4-alpha-carbinolamine dehydratase [Saprospiraceae bacterium]|nr:pterin-4-alpha-carbinolamine dehydratase [Saprospiraceae bacterium]
MWQEKEKALHRTFEFEDFTEAFSFMTAVAIIAEKQNHHPEWTNVWNSVSFKLNTHDAGSIVTQKDWDLAKAIDKVFEKYKK